MAFKHERHVFDRIWYLFSHTSSHPYTLHATTTTFSIDDDDLSLLLLLLLGFCCCCTSSFSSFVFFFFVFFVFFDAVVHVVPSPGGEGLGLDAKRHKVEGCCENNRSDSSKSERLSINSLFFASFFSSSSSSPMIALFLSSSLEVVCLVRRALLSSSVVACCRSVSFSRRLCEKETEKSKKVPEKSKKMPKKSPSFFFQTRHPRSFSKILRSEFTSFSRLTFSSQSY